MLPEHRNTTRAAHLSDRSKITSRAQLYQLRHGSAAQGISIVVDELKPVTAPLLPFVHGLINTGNSCFLNSVLQALSAISVLPPYLESILKRSVELQLNEDEVQVSEALLDTVEALQQPLASQKAFRPRAIVTALETSRAKDSKSSGGYYNSIMNREQQDAQELFQMISSALSSEETVVQKQLAIRPLLNMEFLKKLVGLGSDKLEYQVKKQNSNPLIGMLASRLSCMQCGYTEAVRHFTFDNLSLSLPPHHSCTIEDCLRQYINLESLHDVVCRKCSLLATLARIQRDIKRLDNSTSATGAHASIIMRRRRRRHMELEEVEDVHADSDGSSFMDSDRDAYSESDLDFSLEGSDDEMTTMSRSTNGATSTRSLDHRQHQAGKRDPTKLIAQLTLQQAILESAIKSDVERTLPKHLKLFKVVSRHCTKQVMIAKPPPVLCLHFIRSQYSNYGTISKNSCHVQFPEYLDISPFCTTGVLLTQPNLPMSISEQELGRLGGGNSDSIMASASSHSVKQHRQASQMSSILQNKQERQGRVMYRLQSIVVHYGGHSYGHFIAYRRKPDSMQSKLGAVGLGLNTLRTSRAGTHVGDDYNGADDWFRISDETVEAVTLDHVLRSNPYMCLYERMVDATSDAKEATLTVGSSLSLQAVELGLRKLLAGTVKVQSGDAGMKIDKKKAAAAAAAGNTTMVDEMYPNQVDLTALTEKEYADLFKQHQPRAVSAFLRMGHHQHNSFLEQDEDMSDMESVQSYDGDAQGRAWRSFVSSPNSTTPPSPSTGSSDSSTTSSSFTSPVLRQRSHNRVQSLSLSQNGLRIQSPPGTGSGPETATATATIPDLDLVFQDDSSSGASSSLSPATLLSTPSSVIIPNPMPSTSPSTLTVTETTAMMHNTSTLPLYAQSLMSDASTSPTASTSTVSSSSARHSKKKLSKNRKRK
ncbi:hypothetical protein EDD11_006165 [Mortierella claussenii]|nr:hypothetical protein EDD11_006165 [Mortierella claussenii]